MQLGETIATYDVALALRGESGKFDVTSPTGEIYHVTCKSGHSITNLQCSGDGANPQPFVIRKVAEPVSSVPEKTVSTLIETPAQPRVAKTPFLISSDEDDLISERSSAMASAPQVPQLAAASEEIYDLGLDYLEIESTTQQPVVCVQLRGESLADRAKLTKACTTFNEFDVQIRRLHAQLDEIRYRARKKFYEARTMAAGA
jgi:hypothetical protein